MNEAEHPDAALDALLRAAAPEPVPDDGFVDRTLRAVEKAARALPARRPAPVAPLAIARALVAERQRQAGRARQWRWAIAGAIAGYVLMLLALATSPASIGADVVAPTQWLPLAALMAAGSVWVAWRAWR